MSKQSDEAYQRYKHLTEMDYGHAPLPIPDIDLFSDGTKPRTGKATHQTEGQKWTQLIGQSG